ncbi:hypothetical protein ACVMAJ_006853 [Bradyrhizobium sp. USDA 4448]
MGLRLWLFVLATAFAHSISYLTDRESALVLRRR